MVTKKIKRVDALEKLQKEEELNIKNINELKGTRINILDSEMDTAFYFSVIFNTREERDNWLKRHNIKLMDNYSVKAEDFIN